MTNGLILLECLITTLEGMESNDLTISSLGELTDRLKRINNVLIVENTDGEDNS